MKNTQLLKMLGEIDNKFLDEALGGDSEKPLKIDTSRAPVKWYRIAASIAACLVLGAGVITLSRFINKPSPVDPPAVSDTSSVPNIPVASCISVTEADLETCKQLMLEENPDIANFRTRIMDINFDGVDEAVLNPDGGATGLYIFSKTDSMEIIRTGVIDVDSDSFVLYDLSDFFRAYYPSEHNESGSPYWYFCYTAGINVPNDIAARAIARITYDGTGYGIDYPAAVYARLRYENLTYSMDNARFKKNWSPKHDLYGEGGDTGVEIDQSEFLSIWEKHLSLNELGSDFADYLADEDDIYLHNVQTFFPYLDLNSIPLMDSASFDPSQSNVIKRARIAETSVCPHAGVSAALVGENIFRLAEDGKEYMRMEKLSVIYYYKTKLYAQVYLEPVAPGGGRGNFVIRAKKDLPITAHHCNYTLDYSQDLYGKETNDTEHVIAIGGDDFMRTPEKCTVFVRLNTLGAIAGDDTKPKLTVLKGIPVDGDTPTAYINLSSDRADTIDALINDDNNISTKISFFPEMFDYADPDAAHAHFTCKVISINGMGGGLGGRFYNFDFDNDNNPTLGMTPEETLGSEEDFARFKNFISSGNIAVIHVVATRKPGPMSESKAIKILDIIKNADLRIFSDSLDLPVGEDGYPALPVNNYPGPVSEMGRSADEFEIYGCGSDGSVLFWLYHNVGIVSVAFDDCQTSYLFDDINHDISKIHNYLGYDD